MREREFEVGSKVLVLLPTSTTKLIAQCRGSYSVVARKERVNYEVDVGEGRKCLKIYHINMLGLWMEPMAQNLWVEEEEEAETEISTWERD